MLRNLLCILAAFAPISSFGLGFEKGIVLSGKHAGNANAATSVVAGAESLIFNPAGLARTEGRDFVFGITASDSSFEAPFVGEETEAAKSVATPLNVVYADGTGDNISWGFGFLITGGLKSDHGRQSFAGADPGFSLEPQFKSELTIMELTPGVAYKVNDKLSVGVSYRISYTTAELSAGSFAANVATNTNYLAELNYKDLEGYNFEGVRVGVQYQEDDWGIGFNYRNEISLDLEGKATAQEQASISGTGTGINSFEDDDIEVGLKLPQAFTLAGHYTGFSNSIIMLELGYYNYDTNDGITVDGTINSTLLSGLDILNDVKANSKDSTVARLGYTYTGYSMPIRAGFIYASQVNNEAYATPGGEAPGNGFGYSLGSTYDLGTSAIHFAADYSYNRASVSSNDVKNAFSGDYDTTAFSLHVGYQLMF